MKHPINGENRFAQPVFINHLPTTNSQLSKPEVQVVLLISSYPPRAC
jgi:hypothetical protein